MDMIKSLDIHSEGQLIDGKMITKLLVSAVNSHPKLKLMTYRNFWHGGKPCNLIFGCTTDIYDLQKRSQWLPNLRSNHKLNTPLDIAKERIQHVILSGTQDESIKLIAESLSQIKTLEIQNCDLKQDGSIKSIADSLPQIETLKIEKCNLEQDEYRNTTIDISRIRHLKRLDLDITYVGTKRRYIFIKMELTIENKEAYFATDGGKCFVHLFYSSTPKFLNARTRFNLVTLQLSLLDVKNWMK